MVAAARVTPGDSDVGATCDELDVTDPPDALTTYARHSTISFLLTGRWLPKGDAPPPPPTAPTHTILLSSAPAVGPAVDASSAVVSRHEPPTPPPRSPAPTPRSSSSSSSYLGVTSSPANTPMRLNGSSGVAMGSRGAGGAMGSRLAGGIGVGGAGGVRMLAPAHVVIDASRLHEGVEPSATWLLSAVPHSPCAHVIGGAVHPAHRMNAHQLASTTASTAAATPTRRLSPSRGLSPSRASRIPRPATRTSLGGSSGSGGGGPPAGSLVHRSDHSGAAAPRFEGVKPFPRHSRDVDAHAQFNRDAIQRPPVLPRTVSLSLAHSVGGFGHAGLPPRQLSMTAPLASRLDVFGPLDESLDE